MSEYDYEEEMLKDVEFELKFYSHIAGSNKFEILPIPLMDGSYLSQEEKQHIVEDCKNKNITLIYRISNGSYATIFCLDTKRVGLVSENDPHGFPC